MKLLAHQTAPDHRSHFSLAPTGGEGTRNSGSEHALS